MMICYIYMLLNVNLACKQAKELKVTINPWIIAFLIASYENHFFNVQILKILLLLNFKKIIFREACILAFGHCLAIDNILCHSFA